VRWPRSNWSTQACMLRTFTRARSPLLRAMA
jgi:hypothetical protein